MTDDEKTALLAETEARDRIRELEAERRWVPVNEKLPESDKVGCLVTYRCFSDGAEDIGIEAPAWYSSRDGHWHDRGGEHIDWHYLNDGCEVLAWMVAPELYRSATIHEGPVSRAEALQISRRILEQAEAERTAQTAQEVEMDSWRSRIVCPCCGWVAPKNRKRVIGCPSCGAISAGDYFPTLGEIVTFTDAEHSVWVEADVSAFLREVLRVMEIEV